jgi:hypothetical protein
MKTFRRLPVAAARARRAFIHPVLLMTIAFAGASGLGVVWAKHQITVTANHARDLERKIDQAQRNLDELNTALTGARSVNTLERLNTELRLGLVPPAAGQVVHVSAAEERLFAARGATGALPEFAAPAPAAGTMRLTSTTRARR